MRKTALKKNKKIANKKNQKKLQITWKNLFQFFFMIPVLLLFIGVLSVLIVEKIEAATNNQQINFQGKIVNKTAGTNITDGTYSFTFKIYDSASGGNLQWSETQSSVSVTNGIFQVALGSVTPLSVLNFTNPNYWLDITFNGETFGTRIQLGAVPTAIDALNLDGVVATQSATGFTMTGGTATLKTLTLSDNTTLGTNGLTFGGGESLTLTANKSVSFSNALAFAGTDSTTMTFPSTSTTIAGLSVVQTFSASQTISPTTASAVGLTVNTTTNATPADALDVITAHTSGTATNGLLINQNAAGTTTNGLQIKQTSGTLTNGLVFTGSITNDITTGSSNRNLTIAPNGTGVVAITSGATTSNGFSITATSITQGASLKIVGGTGVTTGGDMDINGAVYIHTVAETGNLAKFTFTDNSTNTSGASVTNGLDIESAFTTTGAGTKAITGLNISSPTTTSCTTGACSWTGLKITTPAAATNVTAYGLQVTSGTNVPGSDMVNITNASSTGVTTAGVNALSINYVGGAAAVEAGALRLDLTPGGTSGGTWDGVRMVANTTGPASGVTETGVKIEGPTTGGAGTFNGINMLNILPGAGGTANGITMATGAFTQTTAVTGTINGLNLSAGAVTQNTAAGTIGWNGLAITNPNITQSTGTVTADGIHLTTGTNTTGGTQNGINLVATGVSVGTLTGITISSITPGGGTETALNIGTGWDNGLVIGGNALPNSGISVNTNSLGNSVVGINQLGAGDIFTASASGTTRFRISNTGSVLFQGDTISSIGSGASGNGSNAVVNAMGDQGSMIPNAGFESTIASSLADGWFPAATTSAGIFSRDTSTPAKGSASLMATLSNTTAAIYSTCIPVSGAVGSYTLNYYAKASSTKMALSSWVLGYTSKANCQSDTSVTRSMVKSTAALTTSWALYGSGTTAVTTFGATATWARVHFLFSCTSGCSAISGEIDGVRFTESSTGQGLDYAENYPTDPQNPARAADVVALKPGGPVATVIPATNQMDGVLGVVSSNPGETLDDGSVPSPKVPVALAGRIPTKVSTENGAIHMGDYVTASDMPGVAVKATAPGQVIGIALEEYTDVDPTHIGTVVMFVKNSYYSGSTGLAGVGAGMSSLIDKPSVVDTTFANQPATESAGTTLYQVGVTSSVGFSVDGSATISGNLRVKTNGLFEGLLTVLDTITTHNLLVSGTSDFLDMVIFHKGVQFATAPVFPKDTAGFAVIHKGAKSVDVLFTTSYDQTPIIQTTLTTHTTVEATESAQEILTSNYSYVITNESTKGFTIVLSKPALNDVYFSWIAVSVASPALFESVSQASVLGAQLTPTPILTNTNSSSSSAGNQSQ